MAFGRVIVIMLSRVAMLTRRCARGFGAPLHAMAACLLVVGLLAQLAATCTIGPARASDAIDAIVAFPICHGQMVEDAASVDQSASGDRHDRAPADNDAPCPFCSTCGHAVALPPPFIVGLALPVATSAKPRASDRSITVSILVRIAALPRGPPSHV